MDQSVSDSDVQGIDFSAYLGGDDMTLDHLFGTGEGEVEILVTPGMALVFLSTMKNNRHLSMPRALQFRSEIETNQFSSRIATLATSSYQDGRERVVDGQHRLQAVVLAGVPVMLRFVRNMTEAEVKAIDTGASRSGGDILAFRGVKNAKKVAAVCRFEWLYARDELKGEIRSPSNREIEEIYEKNQEISDYTTNHHNVGFGQVPRTTVAGINWLSWKTHVRSPEVAAIFFLGVRDGVGLSEGDPRLGLREFLYRDAARSTTGRVSPLVKTAICVKAWNAYGQGKTIQSFRWRREERFPDPIDFQ